MRKANKRAARDGCIVPFHTVNQASLVGGFYSITASPTGMSSRLPSEADTWAHFRLLSLEFRLHAKGINAATGAQAAGYVGGLQDTPPSTIATLCELLPSCYLAAPTQSVPTEWVKVSQADCRGTFPWYKSIPGAADATEEAPGALVVVGTGTDSFCIEFRGVVEFKTAVNPGNTPAAVALRSRVREERVQAALLEEKKRLLAIMAASPPSVTARP